MTYHWLTRTADENRRNEIDFHLLAPIPELDKLVTSSIGGEQELDDFMKTMAGMG